MIKKIGVALLIGALSSTAIANKSLDDLRAESKTNDGWRLSKYDRRHEIKAYVKNEEGKNIRSFRVEAYLDAPIETVTRVQADVDSYARWYFEVLEAKMLKKVSDKEFIFYMVHDAPVGMPDRDVVLKATIEPMTATKPFIVINMVSLPDFIPEKPPYVRMEAENYVVKLTPQGKDRTLLESEGFIDPGGVSPAWAINFVQGKGPYANMLGMRRMLTLPQYQDKKAPMPFSFFE
jgi:hypothetical protein